MTQCIKLIIREILVFLFVVSATGCTPGLVFDLSIDLSTSAPVITSVSPTYSSREGGGTLTVYGENFQIGGVSVTVGGQDCGFITYISPREITCVLPTLPAGVYDVSVTNPDAQSTTFTGAFSYYRTAAVYVSDGTGEIFQYTIHPETGLLSSMSVDSVLTATTPTDVVIDPSGRHVYSPEGSVNSTDLYSTDDLTNSLTYVSSNASACTATGAAISPNGSYFYETSSTNSICISPIDASTGVLGVTVTSALSSAASSDALLFHPSGIYAYAIERAANLIEVFSVSSSNGTLSHVSATATGLSPLSGAIDPTGRFLYVTNSNNNSISQYIINAASGSLTTMTPSSVSAGNQPSSIVVDPTGRFAYAVNTIDNTISQYFVQSSGALAAMTPATVSTGSSPISVALDPRGLYLYVANSTDSTVSQYEIDPITGALSPLSTPTIATGTGPIKIITALDSSRSTYVVDSGNNTQIQLAFDPTSGLLTEIQAFSLFSSSSFQQLSFSPSGKYGYLASSSLSTIGEITQNLLSGGLATNSASSSITTGSNALFFALDPSGRFGYSVNSGANTLSYLAASLTTGALTSTGSISTGAVPQSIAIHPSARFAYVANKYDNTISLYSLDSSGTPTALSTPTQTTGNSPVAIAIDPFGTRLFVLNYGDNTISQYIINTITGALTLNTTLSTDAGPIAMVIHPSGASLFVISTTAGTVTQFTNPTGMLAANVPVSVATGNTPVSGAFDPSGRFFFVVNSLDISISEYSYDPTTSLLTLSDTLTLGLGSTPAGFTFSPR